jgi:prepilin-type processing-associated H-X9-DG protein
MKSFAGLLNPYFEYTENYNSESAKETSWVCPSQPENELLRIGRLFHSYGINHQISYARGYIDGSITTMWKKLGYFNNPGKTSLFMDSDANCPLGGMRVNPDFTDSLIGRHNELQNIMFIDGHVSNMPFYNIPTTGEEGWKLFWNGR